MCAGVVLHGLIRGQVLDSCGGQGRWLWCYNVTLFICGLGEKQHLSLSAWPPLLWPPHLLIHILGT